VCQFLNCNSCWFYRDFCVVCLVERACHLKFNYPRSFTAIKEETHRKMLGLKQSIANKKEN